MEIKLYNTLTRNKEDFEPITPGQVGLYSCGPTVYHYAHIGNLRSNLLSDLIRRMFEYQGLRVTQVINITDVGHLTGDGDLGQDKIEKEAQIENKTAGEIADFYLNAWNSDIKKMNIKTDGTIFPRATLHIQEQIDLIKQLEDKGITYKTSDGIYFNTAKYDKYSELAQLDIEGLREGARIETNQEKINPTDFALWKFSQIKEQRQQEWPSPWGVGFPGWHIECSAMSMKYLGNHFDIHTGAIDLIPVHHTNERAQSESATGEPYVNYWMHSGFLNVDDEKMAKSEGNFYTLSDLEDHKVRPLAYRYWLLTANYKKTINFTWEAVLAAQTGLDRMISILAEIQNKHGNDGKISDSYQTQFSELVSDDLNTPQALALIWDLLRDEDVEPADKLATILDFDRFLGLELDSAIKEANIEIPKEVVELANLREQARKDKDYSRSDDLRQEITQLGYSVDDTDEGPKIRKI